MWSVAFLYALHYANTNISRGRVSVSLLQASIVSKRLNVGSHKQRHVIAKGLLVFYAPKMYAQTYIVSDGE